mmetsp:Transcript_116850/g.203332  ORF Transcript_116850/g.203332 Transcript_116850/m.203332 type:complete len:320 (+) Transcript_116850:207-1166(+)
MEGDVGHEVLLDQALPVCELRRAVVGPVGIQAAVPPHLPLVPEAGPIPLRLLHPHDPQLVQQPGGRPIPPVAPQLLRLVIDGPQPQRPPHSPPVFGRRVLGLQVDKKVLAPRAIVERGVVLTRNVLVLHVPHLRGWGLPVGPCPLRNLRHLVPWGPVGVQGRQEVSGLDVHHLQCVLGAQDVQVHFPQPAVVVQVAQGVVRHTGAIWCLDPVLRLPELCLDVSCGVSHGPEHAPQRELEGHHVLIVPHRQGEGDDQLPPLECRGERPSAPVGPRTVVLVGADGVVDVHKPAGIVPAAQVEGVLGAVDTGHQGLQLAQAP